MSKKHRGQNFAKRAYSRAEESFQGTGVQQDGGVSGAGRPTLDLKGILFDGLRQVFEQRQPTTGGLQSVARRVATRVPERNPLHWLMMLGVDRIQVDEKSLVSFVKRHPFMMAAVALGLVMLTAPDRVERSAGSQ